MTTEEKAEELAVESAENTESAAEIEDSDVVDAESLETVSETEQAAENLSEFSNFSEKESKENAEKTEKISAKSKQNFSHADKTADEKKKADENSENFNGTFECALTTFDNPFDPLQKFDDWFRFDEEKGYHTCAYLGRIAQINDEMSDEEVLQEIERAIDEIVKYDFMNIYKKVKRPAES